VAEPFKTSLNAALVAEAAAHLQRAWPAFERERFESLASDGLDALELKQRAMHICDALQATLPADFATAAAIVEAALAPPYPGEDLGSLRMAHDGLAGWIVWPLGEFVARNGIDQPERALQTLHALTQRFSAEFAIRPFLARHPALALSTLQRWTRDPSHHVRRLASEGSRPRLPWGMQLRALVADPTPTLPILLALQDDPSAYVRRSVANHLNDIAKDHPGVVADWLRTHLPGASKERKALLRHASRTLVKRGDPAILATWGVGRAFEGEASVAVAPAEVEFGGELTLEATLRSSSTSPQALVVDYAVHHVKANGGTSAKVFKGWTLSLAPAEVRVLARRHSLRPISTRRYHAGRHAVEILVNGAAVASAGFELLPAPDAPTPDDPRRR